MSEVGKSNSVKQRKKGRGGGENERADERNKDGCRYSAGMQGEVKSAVAKGRREERIGGRDVAIGGGALAAGLQGPGCLRRGEGEKKRRWRQRLATPTTTTASLCVSLPLSSSCSCRGLQGEGSLLRRPSDGWLQHVPSYVCVCVSVRVAWLRRR